MTRSKRNTCWLASFEPCTVPFTTSDHGNQLFKLIRNSEKEIYGTLRTSLVKVLLCLRRCYCIRQQAADPHELCPISQPCYRHAAWQVAWLIGHRNRKLNLSQIKNHRIKLFLPPAVIPGHNYVCSWEWAPKTIELALNVSLVWDPQMGHVYRFVRANTTMRGAGWIRVPNIIDSR